MLTQTVKITNPKGLHARPSAFLVKTASLFSSTIRVSNGSRMADAKQILSVLTLAATFGTTLSITIDGSDEASAMKAVVAAINVSYEN